jgi:hypothetical protein
VHGEFGCLRFGCSAGWRVALTHRATDLARHRVAEMLSNVQPAVFYAAQGGSLSGGSRTGRGLVGGGPQNFQTPASLRK